MTTAYERAVARSESPAFMLYGEGKDPRPSAIVSPNPLLVAGHNGGPPLDSPTPPTAFDLAEKMIVDLYEEAKNWADGEPIASQEIADQVTRLYDGLHDAGRVAEGLRVEEKKPHDDAVAAIQAKWNPLVQAKKGKVAMGKEALGALLTAWRTKVAAEKAAEAARRQAIADAAAAEAQEAIRASAGNLADREKAEEKLDEAKEAARWAKRGAKAATTGTGLRTVWVATLVDSNAALDWSYARDPAAFNAIAQGMADAVVRSGGRLVPGFEITDTKVAN